MRRLRAVDLILLATLLPLWLACVWTSVVVGLRGGQLRLPLIVRSAESADAYPTVWATAWPAELPTSAVRVGDEIRRANERDLRGRSTLVATMLMMRAARASESRSPSLTFARAGESFDVRVAPVPRRDWWSLLPFSFACVGAVTFVLLRRPDWRFARRFFLAGVWGGCGFLYFYGFEPASAAAFLLSQLVAVPLAMSLALDFAIELARGGRPRTRWQAALPWIWGVAYSGQFALVISWAPPVSLRGYFVLRAALITVYTVALLAALVSGYRASEAAQRRQLRWVVYGLVVGVTPLFVSYALPAFGISPAAQRIAYFAGSLALVAIPLGILVAIVWFDLLDVDRLISATASYTILAVVGFAVLLLAAPALAEAATGALGVSASGAQLAVAVLLAAVVVPAQRVLRPRLDRLFLRG
jgi:hypothetical protein